MGLLADVQNNGTLSLTTKKVMVAAISTIGWLKWDNMMTPDFTKWQVGSPELGGGTGLNCWTAVIYWAFQGGGVSQQALLEYHNRLTPLAGNMTAMNPVFEKLLRYDHSVAVGDGWPAVGSVLFFSVPDRPLSHVTLSLGDGKSISCWQIRSHPVGMKKPEYSAGFTHVIDNADLRQVCGGPQCTLRATTRPFWEIPMTPY